MPGKDKGRHHTTIRCRGADDIDGDKLYYGDEVTATPIQLLLHMLFPETSSNLVVSCAARIAPFLSKEIAALGYKDHEVFKTGVKLRGSMRDCIKLNLHLRTASQVHYSLKSFAATNAAELYSQAKSIPWEEIIEPGGIFQSPPT